MFYRTKNLPLSNPKLEKSGKYDGIELKRWQQKMLFYLSTLHLAKFLQVDPPESGIDRDSVLAVDAWTKMTSFAERMTLSIISTVLS